MEKKILKGITIWTGVFTVCVCACLIAMPWMKEQWVLAAEMAAEMAMVEETPIQIVEETSDDEQQEKLKIEIPEGLDGRNIKVEDDFIHKTIYVRFSQGVDNYSENYSIHGSSNHIANLTYYKDGDAGVLEISLDKACEMSYSYEDGFLCMSLVDPHEIYDKVVVIDAGHGGSQPGAVKRNILEKDLNLAIVKEIKALFDASKDKSIGVYYTRLDDTHVTLMDRADMANNLEADLFISIHNNASGSGRFNNENGTLVMYSPDDEEYLSSKHLSQICLENVCATAGSTNVGLIDGDDIYIIRSSEVPVALIEVGYMTNHEELDKLITAEYQKLVAKGVYNAIIQAFEEGF